MKARLDAIAPTSKGAKWNLTVEFRAIMLGITDQLPHYCEVSMKDNPWFAEKAPQIDVPSMMAFGISITTRHSKARELAELLMFAHAAADANLNMLVKEAFYDSNSDCCTFTFRDGVEQYSPQERALFSAAMKTVSQFEWFGSVYHGAGSEDEEESF